MRVIHFSATPPIGSLSAILSSLRFSFCHLSIQLDTGPSCASVWSHVPA
jgi:hypothetical protein